jgi:hypothetical protein
MSHCAGIGLNRYPKATYGWCEKMPTPDIALPSRIDALLFGGRANSTTHRERARSCATAAKANR